VPRLNPYIAPAKQVTLEAERPSMRNAGWCREFLRTNLGYADMRQLRAAHTSAYFEPHRTGDTLFSASLRAESVHVVRAL
jgi:hypothetical protein